MNNERLYPPGTLVDVWVGATVGSPGIPPPDPETVTGRIDHWNSVGQAYVYFDTAVSTGGGNSGMYVFAPAIIRVTNVKFTPEQLREVNAALRYAGSLGHTHFVIVRNRPGNEYDSGKLRVSVESTSAESVIADAEKTGGLAVEIKPSTKKPGQKVWVRIGGQFPKAT